MSPRASRTMAGLIAALALIAGCRQILSIEERELDPLSCEAYCERIEHDCTAGRRQFSSVQACMGLCSVYPLGTLEDKTGHTLACRINALEAAEGAIEDSDCAEAGPGGNGVCGDLCESFCTTAFKVCPQTFEGVMECKTACADLITCGLYSVDPDVTPNDPSLNCRLYHVSAAAINLLSAEGGTLTDSQLKHCPHAAGEMMTCEFVDPPDPASQCP